MSDKIIRSEFLVCILLGISPASDYGLPAFRNTLSVPSSKAGCEDGTDRVLRNVGKPYSDAGEIPEEYRQDSKHGESLKSRVNFLSL